MHTMFGVIRTYGYNVALRTRNALKKGVEFKNGTRKCNGSYTLHFESLPETWILGLESFEPVVTKLNSVQEMFLT